MKTITTKQPSLYPLILASALCGCLLSAVSAARAQRVLPDAPSFVMANADETTPGLTGLPTDGGADAVRKAPCPKMSWRWREGEAATVPKDCQRENQLQSIVSTGDVQPLTPRQKALLGVRDIVDPFNLATIGLYSTISVAVNSHSAYGPGFKGAGRVAGYSLLEDTQGEFFGTFLIPTLAQEDPRYHRMPDRPVKRRILHALAHTAISQHDNGTLMPNYAVLVTYPVSALLSDAYVPGIETNASATAKRIVLGYATNPAGDLVAEFLPDVAKRIHVRVVFVQEILNRLATGSPNTL